MDHRGLPKLLMGEPPTPPCDFDRVMAPAQQTRWIADVSWRDRDGLRADHGDLRGRFAPRFERLRAMDVWGDVEAVLRRYVRAAVPAPRRSERAFWACTCLPDSDGVTVLAQVGVGASDVCTVTADGGLAFSFRLGLDPLDLPRVAARAGLSVDDEWARAGGGSGVVLRAAGAAAALGLFDDEVIVRGMRRFNLDLARGGACDLADRHNVGLADVLLAESDVPPSPAPGDAAYDDPSPPDFDQAMAEVDRLLAEASHEEARGVFVSALLRLEPAVGGAEPPSKGLSRDDRAAIALRSLLDAFGPDDPAFLVWLPRARLLQGCEGDANVAALLAIIGTLHRRAGRAAEGIEFLARAATCLEYCRGEFRHAPAYRLELGRCYVALGQFAAAQEHLYASYQPPAPERPPRLAVECALAERHLAAGDVAAARDSLEASLARVRSEGHDPLYPHLLAPLAWCEERLGTLDRAVAHYAEALGRLDATAPAGMRRGVLAGLVRCHDRRGETASADDYLRRAEAMTERAWPIEGPWPLEDLVTVCLAVCEPARE